MIAITALRLSFEQKVSLFGSGKATHFSTSMKQFIPRLAKRVFQSLLMEEKARRESWVDNGRDDYPAEEDNSWEYHQYQAGVVGFENYKSDNY